ncbi:hypothetical protein BUALT_Bualt04G0053500 [Buddleja alternifolia]|uniref:Uncharacterized protein n=1 Tax=Buddleja alternifolia TaxID=168488 RepID=A0AAV6XLJ2_9LAMI|nr:hypothetical protein BUALT_Bualt04G0053500 [Buddleja alternifolia]
MDYSGLPIPIGGSEPLSSVLLELSSQGTLTLTNVPMPSPPHNMLTNPTDAQTTPQSHLSHGFQQNGNPLVTDHFSRLQNLLGNNRGPDPIDTTSYYSTTPSPYPSFGTVNNAGLSNIGASPHQHSPISGLSPMASRAHMNLLHQMEKNNRKAGKRPLPLVEQPSVNYSGYIPVERLQPSVNYSGYIPGTGVQRLNEYMFQQKNRPQDNNIQFWRNFVAEFFAPSAKKRWCVSLYKNSEQMGDDYKVARQCGICNMSPCYGFEINEDVLPEVHKRKYDLGVLDERLHVDTPPKEEYASGHIILHFSKAREETQYQHATIARYGHLRLLFSPPPHLKICSWEFCVHHHQHHMPTNSINHPQVYQLGTGVPNYQTSNRGAFPVPPPQLQTRKDMIVSSAYQMVEALGMSYLSQIGIARRNVQCLQIPEVLNNMNNLMDYSQEHGTMLAESIAKFPCFGSNVRSGKTRDQQPEQQSSPLAPYFSALAGPESKSGFCNTGLGNTTASTSTGPNNQKRQRICQNNPYTPTTSVGFSFMSPGHFNFSSAVSTPFSDIRPQMAHTALGKSGQQYALRNLHMEPKDYHSILADLDNPESNVEKYIQRVLRAQAYTKASVSENQNGILQNGGNALANNTNGGTSNRIVHIDVENNEVKDNGVGSFTPASGTTPSVAREEEVFPRDPEGNYLPQEYDEHFLGELMDFEELFDLLK